MILTRSLSGSQIHAQKLYIFGKAKVKATCYVLENVLKLDTPQRVLPYYTNEGVLS